MSPPPIGLLSTVYWSTIRLLNPEDCRGKDGRKDYFIHLLCAPGGQKVNSNKSVTNYYYYYYYYYYGVTLQNLSIDTYIIHEPHIRIEH